MGRQVSEDDVPLVSREEIASRVYGSAQYQTEMERLSISMAKASREILEDLSSCSGQNNTNDDESVPDGEDPFENATIETVRDLVAQGNSLSKTPWGENARDNRAFYIADTGHQYVIKPKNPEQGKVARESQPVKRVTAFLKLWMAENGWQLRQSEVSQRLDRHGECLDLMHYSNDGMLRLDFVEPDDLDEDANSDFNGGEDTDKEFVDDLGIRRTNNLLYRRVGYFVDNGNSRGVWIGDARFHTRRDEKGNLVVANYEAMSGGYRSLINYRVRNALSGEPRGLHLYYSSRRYLRWATVLLQNLMRVSGFQAAFGAIRTIHSANTADAVKNYLNTAQNGKVGSTPDTYDMPAPGVVTTGSNVKYEFPETGAGATNHIEVLVQLLRACASGMKLPEFMLTSNVSEGNFASTLVSEGPFHKGMRFSQQQMVTEDETIIWQALMYAAESGNFDLTIEDVMSVTIEAKPPRVQTRNRKEDFDIAYQLWEGSVISAKTLAATEGFEFDEEQKQIAEERKNEIAPPQIANVTPPGPVPAKQNDPMKEKGVLAGDPGRNPQV